MFRTLNESMSTENDVRNYKGGFGVFKTASAKNAEWGERGFDAPKRDSSRTQRWGRDKTTHDEVIRQMLLLH